jgi:hypothetical protein
LSIGIWIARSRLVSRLRIGSATEAKSAMVICWPGSTSRTATRPVICDACVTAPGRTFSSGTAVGLKSFSAITSLAAVPRGITRSAVSTGAGARPALTSCL